MKENYKLCGKCKLEKEYNSFSKDKNTKDGFQNSCKECKKKYKKEWALSNKKRVNEYGKKYLIKHPNKKNNYSEKSKEYRNVNKDEISIKRKEYWLKNKNDINKKRRENIGNKSKEKKYKLINKDKINKKRNETIRNKKNKNPLFKLKSTIRTAISNSLNRGGYSKKNKTYDILNIDFNEFKKYIESKFESWMTWENHGKYNGELNYGWDLDHIIPISSALTEGDIIKLNHYTNFQPLCSKINRDIKRHYY
jgi:hypothetical protein